MLGVNNLRAEKGLYRAIKTLFYQVSSCSVLYFGLLRTYSNQNWVIGVWDMKVSKLYMFWKGPVWYNNTLKYEDIMKEKRMTQGSLWIGLKLLFPPHVFFLWSDYQILHMHITFWKQLISRMNLLDFLEVFLWFFLNKHTSRFDNLKGKYDNRITRKLCCGMGE